VSSIQVSNDPTFREDIELTASPDFEKTFIQCIVFNYETLRELGDEPAVKAAGKVMTKGKDYVVEDGDIILIKAGAAKA
jgi:obg-like ATPase 1